MNSNKILKIKNKINSLLVIEANFSNFNLFLKQYIKSIICENNICNECLWCKKVDNNSYYDIVFLDAKNGKIRKEDIISLINNMNNNGLESINKKFYIIKNIEFLKKQCSNSLLKFIEETPTNIYPIFTTRKINLVLPTIVSRCSPFVLESNQNEIEEFYKKNNLNIFQQRSIIKCYDNIEEATKNISDFFQLYYLSENILKKDNDINIYKNLIQIKKMEYDQIKILLIILQNLTDKYEELLQIENDLYLLPNKTLIFNKILIAIKGKNE